MPNPQVFELFGNVVSAGVSVSGLSWSVGELAAVNLVTEVIPPRPTQTTKNKREKNFI